MMAIYEELNLKRIINAYGTMTKLGGSRMDPRVLDAMKAASEAFVDMYEYHRRAGEKIAEYLGAEACCITAGAAAGIAVSAAASMAGTNEACALQLPDTSGMKNEALVLKCHRTLYDQALSVSGIHVREVGNTAYCCLEQVERAVNEKTAMFMYTVEADCMRGSLPLEPIIEILHRYHLPVVVDAASEIPPREIINHYLGMGADALLLSGGKEIRGPQSSGLILGKQQFIEACETNACPHYGIGRCMKIDKETIAGIVKAVELFAQKDYSAIMRHWEEMVNTIFSKLTQDSRIEVWRGFATPPSVQPPTIPRIFVRPLTISAETLQQRMMQQEYHVFVCLEKDTVIINPQCVEDDELPMVCDAVLEAISEAG